MSNLGGMSDAAAFGVMGAALFFIKRRALEPARQQRIPPMADHDLSAWQHDHAFDGGNRSGEARTRAVLAITLITMVAEIFGGWWTGSMALLADGWHMGTHALALGVAAVAYALARSQRPSAVTSSAAMRLSQVSPKRRPSRPMPPPSVRPPMPVSAATPAVVARPKACASRSKLPSTVW